LVVAPEHPLLDALVPPNWPDGVPHSWRGGAGSPSEAVAGYRHAAASKTNRERQESRVKTGVAVGAVATNPTGASIPVFVADYVLMGYGTGAIMGVPGQEERDWEFAEAFDVPSSGRYSRRTASRGGRTPETGRRSTPASSTGSTSRRLGRRSPAG
jgi:leucyl-tRNA synthetase